MITIELSGPPQGKGRGRAFATPNGIRVYTPSKTVKYETQLRIVGTQVMNGRPPLEGPLKIWITARFAVPESWSKKKRTAALGGDILPCVKPDADNIAKLLDGLNEVCFRDDKQAVSVRINKVYSELPGLKIEIMPMETRMVKLDDGSEIRREHGFGFDAWATLDKIKQ